MRHDYSTRAQLLARLRERYATATGEPALKLGAFLADASLAELRAAFGVSQGQVAALQGRLNAQKTPLASLRGAKGE